mmetsp:Transcript_42910/g.86750  ORF Transcript_42910/g.86750 Transcript_42910/m.86750 type:complete len:252 (-) Transcript_42910:348-1103(-)
MSIRERAAEAVAGAWPLSCLRGCCFGETAKAAAQAGAPATERTAIKIAPVVRSFRFQNLCAGLRLPSLQRHFHRRDHRRRRRLCRHFLHFHHHCRRRRQGHHHRRRRHQPRHYSQELPRLLILLSPSPLYWLKLPQCLLPSPPLSPPFLPPLRRRHLTPPSPLPPPTPPLPPLRLLLLRSRLRGLGPSRSSGSCAQCGGCRRRRGSASGGWKRPSKATRSASRSSEARLPTWRTQLWRSKASAPNSCASSP